MTDAPLKTPEFSYEIELGEVGRQGKVFRLAAGEDERRRVAERLGAPSVEKLEGELRVSATKTAIRVEGSIDADLTRECVASLEPMQERVAEDFEIDFLREAPEPEEGEEGWETPEVHEGDRLDLGELLVQHLSLAMDPFPRKEGAESLAETYAPKETISPFAGLKDVLGKDDDNQ
ncbi:MAG: DUF177 domain-containing protein [Oricola sp.]|jgi:uncharacterized metal-binding protein YceD (DUF177 family)|nr:DUF177 domain-containing protein [Oricola sp.]